MLPTFNTLFFTEGEECIWADNQVHTLRASGS